MSTRLIPGQKLDPDPAHFPQRGNALPLLVGSEALVSLRTSWPGIGGPCKILKVIEVPVIDYIDLENGIPLEKGMANHSSILAWSIPWTEEPGNLQSIGLQRVGHEWSNLAHNHSFLSPYYMPGIVMSTGIGSWLRHCSWPERVHSLVRVVAV